MIDVDAEYTHRLRATEPPPRAPNLPRVNDERVVTIDRLLALHRAYAHVPNAIPNYLCDGYMVATNRVIGNIRRYVSALGFRFSSTEMSECKAWPLMGLSYLMDKRVIPYDDTVTLLEHIERGNPGVFKLRDLSKVSRPNRSAILHESSHATIEQIIREERAARGEPDPKTPRHRIFEALLGESFVGTCETFASYFGTKRVQRFLLTGFHSHVPIDDEIRAALDHTIDTFGIERAFQLQAIGYLHYNFLFTKIVRADLRDAIDALEIDDVKPDKKIWRSLMTLFEHSLSMNPTARVYTAFNYQYFMRLTNARTPLAYMKTVDFDFNGYLRRPTYKTALARGAKLVLAAS